MEFTGEEYYRAGRERMAQARRVYQSGDSYSLAMFCGGLAVECILRAFRWTKDKSFEGRHDLTVLLKASDLLRINEEHLKSKGVSDEEIRDRIIELRAATNEVFILWHNNLRYCSEKSLRTFLNRINRLRGIKGDPLKKNALDLLTAAQRIHDLGVALWTSSKK